MKILVTVAAMLLGMGTAQACSEWVVDYSNEAGPQYRCLDASSHPSTSTCTKWEIDYSNESGPQYVCTSKVPASSGKCVKWVIDYSNESGPQHICVKYK